MKSALIIPTKTAGSKWVKTLQEIERQTRQPTRKILLDSGSEDQTTALAEQHGFEVHPITPGTFNHGLTRQFGANLCPDADLLIFMTQDAIPADPTAFENLISSFEKPDVAAAYGCQRPPPGTPPSEIFARHHNYPPESRIKTSADIPSLGLHTAFCSNSFAAWRKTALDEIGGFEKTPFGEDMLAAARLVLAGYSVVYCAEARVFHAHPLSFRETFRRGRQIGELHRRHPWLRERFGKAEKTGSGYVFQGTRILAKSAPHVIPLFLFLSTVKFLGFLSGKSRVS